MYRAGMGGLGEIRPVHTALFLELTAQFLELGRSNVYINTLLDYCWRKLEKGDQSFILTLWEIIQCGGRPFLAFRLFDLDMPPFSPRTYDIKTGQNAKQIMIWNWIAYLNGWITEQNKMQLTETNQRCVDVTWSMQNIEHSSSIAWVHSEIRKR